MNALMTRALLSFALALTVLASAPADASDTACSSAVTLDAGTAWDLVPGSSRGGEVFAVNVDEPGLLAVQAVATGDDSVRTAWLRLLNDGCDGGAVPASAAGASLGSGFVRVRQAGTVYFEAGAVDPGDHGFGLRLSTHLFPPALSPIYGHDGGPDDETEENDGEVLPITVPGAAGDALDRLYGHDGGPDDETEENDGEVLPVRRTNPRRAAHCLGEPGNDLAACAAELRLGTGTQGDLESASGFDQDYFAFQVSGLERIAVSVQTDSPLRLLLTDALGRELATRRLDPGTEATSFEVVLVSGRYYLRLDGPSSPWSTYRLHLSPTAGS